VDIDFDFACRDDCLERMVPSDLRQLVAERDRYRKALETIAERSEDWDVKQLARSELPVDQ